MSASARSMPMFEKAVRGVLLVGFALAALAVGAGGAIVAAAELRLQACEQAVAAAVAMPRGAARDTALDLAQARITDALTHRPEDPRLWDHLGEVRFLQATEAQVAEISAPLLTVAIEASERAEALEPRLPAAPARIAVARALQGDDARARAALRRAFAAANATDGTDENAALRRVRASGRLWDGLDAATRRAVRAEVCLLARDGRMEGLQAAALAASPPTEFLLALMSVQQEPACRPMK